MAGTRRGEQGSGRPTRAEYRPGERRSKLRERLENAKNPREKVSWMSAYLRAVMADPDVNDTDARQIADQFVIYTQALADQLETMTTRKETK